MTQILQDRMGRVTEMVRGRLDRLSDILPPVKPIDKDAYFEDAIGVASRDPEFKAQLESALAQYNAAKGRVGDASRGS